MAKRNPRGVGRFDRKVRLWKPVESELSVDNPYNQKDKAYQVAYKSYPAHRLEALSEIDEKEKASVVLSVSEVEWELRYIPNLPVTASWRIEDLLDGVFYEITSPMTGNGRGTGYRVITNIVQ